MTAADNAAPPRLAAGAPLINITGSVDAISALFRLSQEGLALRRPGSDATRLSSTCCAAPNCGSTYSAFCDLAPPRRRRCGGPARRRDPRGSTRTLQPSARRSSKPRPGNRPSSDQRRRAAAAAAPAAGNDNPAHWVAMAAACPVAACAPEAPVCAARETLPRKPWPAPLLRAAVGQPEPERRRPSHVTRHRQRRRSTWPAASRAVRNRAPNEVAMGLPAARLSDMHARTCPMVTVPCRMSAARSPGPARPGVDRRHAGGAHRRHGRLRRTPSSSPRAARRCCLLGARRRRRRIGDKTAHGGVTALAAQPRRRRDDTNPPAAGIHSRGAIARSTPPARTAGTITAIRPINGGRATLPVRSATTIMGRRSPADCR